MVDKIKEIGLDKAFEDELTSEKIENLKNAVCENSQKKKLSFYAMPKRRFIAVKVAVAFVAMFVIIDVCMYKFMGTSVAGFFVQRFTDKSITEDYGGESAEYIATKLEDINDVISGEYFQCKIVDAIYDDVSGRLIYSVSIAGTYDEYSKYQDTGKFSETVSYYDEELGGYATKEVLVMEVRLIDKSGNSELFYIKSEDGKTTYTRCDEKDDCLRIHIEQSTNCDKCLVGFKSAEEKVIAEYEIDLKRFSSLDNINVQYEDAEFTLTPIALVYHESMFAPNNLPKIDDIEISYEDKKTQKLVEDGEFVKELSRESWNHDSDGLLYPGDRMYFEEIINTKNIVEMRINGQVVYKR